MENEFNPDPSKQGQKVIFSRKTDKENHPPIAFSNNNVSETSSQKHRLSFAGHLKMMLNKVNETIGFFTHFKMSSQDLHCSLYTKVSLDIISIKMTLYVTDLIRHHFIKN